MTDVVTLTLEELSCIGEEDNPSSPYIWPALLYIDKSNGDVSVAAAPLESDDRVLLSSNLQAGQSASIPASVGVETYSVDDPGEAVFLQITVLWQAHDFSANALQDGYKTFLEVLPSTIQANILDLDSTDPQTQQSATDKVEKAVYQAVYNAIENGLTGIEKAQILDGQITLDKEIAVAYQVFRDIKSQGFTLDFGDLWDGRLLSYRDQSTDGSGPVVGPTVIGDSGFNEMEFLFSGGDGIIYGVKGGNLLFYRDESQDGSGPVVGPNVIGQGGWDSFQFLFSGGNGIIYGVKGGNLLFYLDHNRDGTGNVANPSTIGHGGWDAMDFVFSGGNGIIYAVNPQGQLLFYRDLTQDGTGNVARLGVIGQGGWTEFKFLFGAGDGVIYAINPQGELLGYADYTQQGNGNVANPNNLGTGWDGFKFVFAGGTSSKGALYAVEPNPTHGYQIPGTLEVGISISGLPSTENTRAGGSSVGVVAGPAAGAGGSVTAPAGSEERSLNHGINSRPE